MYSKNYGEILLYFILDFFQFFCNYDVLLCIVKINKFMILRVHNLQKAIHILMEGDP
jgi:hypothetical protein